MSQSTLFCDCAGDPLALRRRGRHFAEDRVELKWPKTLPRDACGTGQNRYAQNRAAPARPLTGIVRHSPSRRGLESEITLRADSLLGLLQAAQAVLGLAVLPCYLGDTAPC